MARKGRLEGLAREWSGERSRSREPSLTTDTLGVRDKNVEERQSSCHQQNRWVVFPQVIVNKSGMDSQCMELEVAKMVALLGQDKRQREGQGPYGCVRGVAIVTDHEI